MNLVSFSLILQNNDVYYLKNNNNDVYLDFEAAFINDRLYRIGI